jgi:hypothetical protein
MLHDPSFLEDSEAPQRRPWRRNAGRQTSTMAMVPGKVVLV